nr:hypothetical protein CFP56_31816 [Quercus suber]
MSRENVADGSPVHDLKLLRVDLIAIERFDSIARHAMHRIESMRPYSSIWRQSSHSVDILNLVLVFVLVR